MSVKMLTIAVFALFFTSWQSTVEGHGRLMDPPGRSSVWRFINDDNPLIAPYEDIIEPNYNDNQLFCGGAQHQASLGGMCGVCGDAYDAANPENVAGGTYAKGIIVRQYQQGAWISVTIEITTHHRGFFEFRLCPWDDVTSVITRDCLNQYLLPVTNDYTTRYDITDENPKTGYYHIQVKLPSDVTCDQCVLQWRYRTGNSWGCDSANDCGLGKGPQEEFYGCADVAIGVDSVLPPPGYRDGDNSATSTAASSTVPDSGASSPTTSSTTTTTTTTTTAPETSKSTSSTSTSTTSTSSQNSQCAAGESGYHKVDCHSYYRCSNGVAYHFQCSAGTAFDDTVNACVHEASVSCD